MPELGSGQHKSKEKIKLLSNERIYADVDHPVFYCVVSFPAP
ncbi:hypothetical protein AM1_4960 [Acaryochloris marina MBIC11017]|uniref:Uncharacterized protein n=1 Tax=Acaryochloris marina (strain MBIC 11017) TaxID=329726 RepID=B0C4P8_ACAM1|nr:hypothetical protein AM1_4960 [Acaryochloris marina MBIC11017]